LFNKLIKQRTYRNGGGTLRQIYFAMTDMYLYSDIKEDEEPIDVMRKMADKYLVTKIDESDRLFVVSVIFLQGVIVQDIIVTNGQR
jgi:Zn-dependent oligopeptidase